MKGSSKIRIGVKVVYDGEVHTVVGLEGTTVRLRTPKGNVLVMLTRELIGSEEFEVLDRAEYEENVKEDALDMAEIDTLPQDELQKAREFESHLLEAVTGYPSGEPQIPDQPAPKPEYATDLKCSQRISAKAAELGISESTMWKRKARYERWGVLGLMRQKGRRNTTADRLDPRLREAVLFVLDELTSESNISRQQVIRRVQARLDEQHGKGAVLMPSRATLYRALSVLSRGRNTFGAAKARRSIANRPETTYRRFRATRPGEVVLVDTTSLDVFAADPLTLDWVPLELTIALDLYTRSILAWRFTPRNTKGVDAALILRDIVTPMPVRPRWPEWSRWPYHGVPEQLLFGPFGEQEFAGRPLVLPETVLVDHGMVYESEVFRSICTRLGISVQSARPYAPTDKSQIERTFRTIRESLLENLPGYKGPDVWSRGARVEEAAFYFIEEIEEIFARWVVCYWQNRPHDGLRLPGAPRAKVSPNEMYELGLATAGFVAVPPSPDLYFQLLPIEWRKIGHDGVSVEGLRYDGDSLNPYRNRDSDHGGVHRRKWPIRYDPRDYSRTFFRDPEDGGWYELRWVDAPPSARPFDSALLSHAKGLLRSRGEDIYANRRLAGVLEEIFERVDRDKVIDPKERRALADAFMRGPQAGRDRVAAEEKRGSVEQDEEISVWDCDPTEIQGFSVHGGEAEYVDDPDKEPKKWWNV